MQGRNAPKQFRAALAHHALVILLGALFAFAWFQLASPSRAAAAEEVHAFDPQLSLTGGPFPFVPKDPVPDPGPTHPSKEFGEVCGLAVDSLGYTYVATFGELVEGEEQFQNGRIDIFDPEGHFLLEIPRGENRPCDLAVDSQGTLYVSGGIPPAVVMRFTPTEYPPSPTTDYGSPVVADPQNGPEGIAVNQTNDHLFVAHNNHVVEFSSASTGNTVVSSSLGSGELNRAVGIAVNSSTGEIAVSSLCRISKVPEVWCPPVKGGAHPHVSVVKVFDSSGVLKATIDGSDTPNGGFEASAAEVYPAFDESTGEIFVDDIAGAGPVDRFLPVGADYAWAADAELESHFYAPPSRIAVSNGPTAPTKRNVYVLSVGPPGHVYTFYPTEPGPPIVEDSSVANPTTDEAVLEGVVNPDGSLTNYRFEYVDTGTYAQDLELNGAGHGFDHATVAGSGSLPSGFQLTPVSAVLDKLAPGTSYLFRIIATNCEEGEAPSCTTEGETVRFATYPLALPATACPNDGLRAGPSATLPDCRAYELVTPPDTTGRAPQSAFFFGTRVAFPMDLSTEDGNSVLFMTTGGALPVGGGNGAQDGYEAVRTSAGWQTRAVGPSGAQSQAPIPGGASSDHGYRFWETGSSSDRGTLVVGAESTTYVRLPDGTFQLIGQGPLGTDPRARGFWISPGGRTIFTSTSHLTDDSSPSGTRTIYSRNPGGITEVLSIEPSGNAPPTGADVSYLGTDAGGDTVAFSVAKGGVTSLYQRHLGSGQATLVASGQSTFAGLAEDGGRLTYLQNGDIFSFDAGAGSAQQIGSGGQSTVVNVSADGSHVYFVSPEILSPGPGPSAGQENFYVWNGDTEEIAFIARLNPADVDGGEFGLGFWIQAVKAEASSSEGPVTDPSRTTLDGRVIVFESIANLTDYDAGGHSQVYRYAAGETPALTCVSCSPALIPAVSDAQLQATPTAEDPSEGAVTNSMVPAHNVTTAGTRVFFQTADALVSEDVDQTIDVYEWIADGSGQCVRSTGCVALISSGHSGEPNYLYNVNPSGRDVFFATGDLLVKADQDPAPSIYDARVEGGFPDGATAACAGEACKSQPTPPPLLNTPGSVGAAGSGNVPRGKSCPKGKRRIHRGGKIKCVRRHKKHNPRKQPRRMKQTKSGGTR
jgi:hypothetical protein